MAATFAASVAFGSGLCRVTLTQTSEETKKTVSKPAVLEIVDASGSMMGAPIAALQDVLVDRPPEALAQATRRRVVFGTTAKAVDVAKNYKFVSMGGTNFKAALNMATHQLVGFPENGRVLFLTDGQPDFASDARPNDMDISNFINTCAKCKATVHLLGYGSSHDVNFMTSFLDSLKATGLRVTFDFATTPDEMRQLIHMYSDDMTVNTVATADVQVLTDTNGHSDTLKFVGVSDTQQFHVPGTAIQKITINGNLIKYTQEPPIKGLMMTQSRLFYDLTLAKTASELNALTDRIDQLEADMTIHRKTMTMMENKQAKRDLTTLRQSINDRYLQLATSGAVNKPDQLAAGNAGNLVATQATLLAAKHGIKENLAKKLAKRVMQQPLALNDLDLQVQAVASEFSSIAEIAAGPYDNLTDLIAFMDWREAVRAGTCLVWCLHVDRRNGTSIVDPTQLTILNVVPQVVTYDTFTDLCASDILDLTNVTFRTGKMLVKNMLGMHPFNAVLPMFINPSHWAMSQLFLNLSVANACTGTVDGFQPAQRHVVPLLVLEFLLRKSSLSELEQLILSDVTNLCKTIDSAENCSQTLALFETRNVDRANVPSIPVLLMRARLHGMNVPDILYYEEVRRRVRPASDGRTDEHVTEQIRQLLGLATFDQMMGYDATNPPLAVLDFLDKINVEEIVDMQQNMQQAVDPTMMASLVARLETWLPHVPEPIRSQLTTVETMVWALDQCLERTMAREPASESSRIVRHRMVAALTNRKQTLLNAANRVRFDGSYTSFLHSADAVIPPFVLSDTRNFANGTGSVVYDGGNHLFHGSTDLAGFLRCVRDNVGRIRNARAKMDYLLSLPGGHHQYQTLFLSKRNTRPFLESI